MPVKNHRLVDGKLLRCGYTTGACAAAAAKAATEMLFRQVHVGEVRIPIPSGHTPVFEVLNASFSTEAASCAIKKHSGDDPDITDGILVFATVTKTPHGVVIDGGEGIGRVTKPGLDQPAGNAAINSVPRRMIKDEAAAVCDEHGYTGGISIVISIPGGEELASRTYNPRLGITGGLSILGTSGVVEPMSNTALIGAIRAELQVLAAAGEKKLLIAIGNFGERFASETLGLPLHNRIKCGNIIGDTLAAAVELNIKQILIIGHIGKLVKLGLGMTNTHSSQGDGRRETLIACALRAGADLKLLQDLDNCTTTDAAVILLRESGLLSRTMAILGPLIEDTLKRQVLPETEIGFICFTGDYILTQSGNAENILNRWKDE